MYDLVFVTHIPVFYKINLYNKISEKKKIFVIFIAKETVAKRSKDFISLENATFDYVVLSELAFELRNKFHSVRMLSKVLAETSYKEIIVSGWDLVEFWAAAFLNKKSRLSLALESTIHESNFIGFRGTVKKIFLSRIALVYASGSAHNDLLDALNYKGRVKLTQGVGIIRKPPINCHIPSCVNYRIAYVGRLSEEKNLDSLINVINQYPNITLELCGDGPERSKLEKIALGNVIFRGSVMNKELATIFLTSDFLVLPSRSEPWGLVVEEALYFGLPVIVSDRCGVMEILKNGDNAHIISFENFEAELKMILDSYDANVQIFYGKNLNTLYAKDVYQVNAYL
ncbi:glycosyltransferase [Shewanella holmiensis]|uniref:Glycosyltransferase n=1 Tax=Shewanella holmiensis TaxID=2952222 RepID=A0A9X2WP43_9GAMM|nr:glycosyltransferase [Shewanella holmiensis]MCT7942952.1 glycosyltransferase [Shewanella holmiensis]